MTENSKHIVLSWIALRNDPFSRDPQGVERPGPTLALLFDPESDLKGKVEQLYLFYNASSEKDKAVFAELRREISKRDSEIEIVPVEWEGGDPTDHEILFRFVKEEVGHIRETHPGRLLTIHLSPGTASMHTVWFLVAETEQVAGPFRLLQSIRTADRDPGAPALRNVQINLNNILKAFRNTPVIESQGNRLELFDLSKARSPKLQEVLRKASVYAAINEPILILGERGSGKTSLAKWIRAHSPYQSDRLSGQGWPVVNCGQFINDQLLQSALFGHEKGAFTGADNRHIGFVEQLNGDTLFLDEIGDLSVSAQRLMIRAVEEKRFTRLGSVKPIESDFRLVAATNKSWSEIGEAITPDFLDRIRALVIRMPSLREIQEDIGWLWESILLERAKKSSLVEQVRGIPIKTREEIRERVSGLPLPGNIRDLHWLALHFCIELPSAKNGTEAFERAIVACYPQENELITESLSQAVAKAFLGERSLDGVITSHGRLETKKVFSEIQVFLAEELRRICTPISRVTELSDISKETLYGWRTKK